MIRFIAALFTTAKGWKHPKRPSTDEWINEMWYIHAMEYYSAFKRKESLTHAATSVTIYFTFYFFCNMDKS